MSPAEWTHVTDLLLEAIEVGSVDTLLRSEPASIQDEVRRLLKVHHSLAGDERQRSRQRGGTVLASRYRLESLLGAGGSGEAWLATDLQTLRPVVAKVPHRWEWFREDLRRRFIAEAEALRRVSHPDIVTILDVGETSEGAPFLVMPFVEGQSLRMLTDAGAVDAESAIAISDSLASAIDAAHAAGLVHRDIKPENVLVHHQDGRLRTCLIDFGISLFAECAEQSSTTTRFFGTTQYMAPEQLLGRPVAASDVYAFALVMYEVLAGRALFPALPAAALYENQRKLRKSDVSGVAPAVQLVLYRALQPNASQRFPSAGELAQRLSAAIRGRAPAYAPSRRALIGAGAAAVAGAAWVGASYLPVPQSERRIVYLGGQTFRDVGWKSFGQIDSDFVELDSKRENYNGNRIRSARQGGYNREISARTARACTNHSWEIRAKVRPIHGFIGVGLGLPAQGVRYVLQVVAPDNKPCYGMLLKASHPVQDYIAFPLTAPGEGDFAELIMRYDPRNRAVSASCNGRELTREYRGSSQYLQFQGIFIGIGPYESESGEGVVGDIRYELYGA